MLTSPRLTPPPPPPLLPPARRRGAQPGNTNAFKHGFFTLAGLLPRASVLRRTLHQNPTTAPSLIQTLTDGIKDIAQYLDQVWEAMLAHGKTPASHPSVSLFRAGIHRLCTAIRLKTQLITCLCRIRQPRLELEYLARNALELILWNFDEYGIGRDGDSFRDSPRNSDFNSDEPFDPPGFLLTAEQWTLIQPCLPPPAPAPTRRGRPFADPRPLLDAALYKLAARLPWRGLPPGAPPMLTCRRYYRRLYSSGRLATLYILLYQDLIHRGRTTPLRLVEQNIFRLDRGSARITLDPACPLTWQHRTALLFLQLSLDILRRIQHEKKRAFLDKFPYRVFHQPSTFYLPPHLPSWTSCLALAGSPPKKTARYLYHHPSPSRLTRNFP